MNLATLHKKMLRKAVEKGLQGKQEEAEGLARSIGWVIKDKVSTYMDYLTISQEPPKFDSIELRDKDGNLKEKNGKVVKRTSKKPKTKKVSGRKK